MVATEAGRSSFWAESAVEHQETIHFVFPNGATWSGRIIAAKPPHQYGVNSTII
ncbi:MAG: hypothetical protein R2932_41475 [Caldilineaceae bacterium]